MTGRRLNYFLHESIVNRKKKKKNIRFPDTCKSKPNYFFKKKRFKAYYRFPYAWAHVRVKRVKRKAHFASVGNRENRESSIS